MNFLQRLILAALLLCGISRAADSVMKSAPSGEESSVDDLSRKATDPTASLMAMNFLGTYTGGYYGSNGGQAGHNLDFSFRPVIPFKAFGQPNILRVSVPYQVGGRGIEGFEPVSVFDLVVFNESWGRWGIGPVAGFDTTGKAPDEFVMGPAVGAVYQVNKRLNIGLFSQNVFWDHTATTQLQPIIAYQLGSGWSLSAGDLQFTYDWKEGQWTNVPVGFQLGMVTTLGDLPVRLAVNPQYNLLKRDGLNEWSVSLTFTALFPTR